MKICIMGLGYVGVVTLACLADDNHEIVGIDPVESKVRDILDGRSPVNEPFVNELINKNNNNGRIGASKNYEDGIINADIVFICVGTPSKEDGTMDLDHVIEVSKQIGMTLKNNNSRPLIALRSTCLPGTTEKYVIPTIEEFSGLKEGEDFHVVYHPEFLRESSAVQNFSSPPKIVIGQNKPNSGDLLTQIYEQYSAPVFRISIAEAEMIKYTDNLFHALKVSFVNEIGEISRIFGIDTRKVMEVFCKDTTLNISSSYLKPGFTFGGPCLPKDLMAILRVAEINNIQVPMLKGVNKSRFFQEQSIIERILNYRPQKVGLVGLAFKFRTDDMRGSPYVMIAKKLIGEGIKLSIFDSYVNPKQLIGSNKNMVERELKHLKDLLVNSLDELNTNDVIIVNHPCIDADQFKKWIDLGIQIIDLIGIEGIDTSFPNYEGISW